MVKRAKFISYREADQYFINEAKASYNIKNALILKNTKASLTHQGNVTSLLMASCIGLYHRVLTTK
ncbi:MAG: hypothetical protein QM401_10625 [Bacillota bacterium]|nr:hypothetical protein [Bacillota bacterium]